MTTLVATPPLYAFSTAPSTGVSPEAQFLHGANSEVEEEEERSVALFGPKAAAISEIYAIENECAANEWDGDGAEPISPTAVDRAVEFIRALPDDVPLPESAPDPDGSVALDWIKSRNRVFSLSVGSGSRLSYAWLEGADHGHGVAYFGGVTVPGRILDGIRRAVGYGDTAVRPL